jgi:hypothetical protein
MVFVYLYVLNMDKNATRNTNPMKNAEKSLNSNNVKTNPLKLFSIAIHMKLMS